MSSDSETRGFNAETQRRRDAEKDNSSAPPRLSDSALRDFNAETRRRRDAEENYDSAAPRLSDSAFKETEIGLLPAEWRLIPIEEIVIDSLGGNYGEAEVDEDHTLECYVIRGTDFDDVKDGLYEEVPTRFLKPHLYDKRRLSYGDLLIEVSGGSANQPTGRALLVTDKILSAAPLPVAYTNFVRRIELDQSQVDPQFLGFYWQFLYAIGRTEIYQKRTTGIRNFKYRDFWENEFVPHLPLPEQRRIAGALHAIQEAIAAQEDVIAAARELKRSLMERLFTYGPGAEPALTKETKIGEIPEHWRTTRLEEWTELVTKGSSPNWQGFDYCNDGITFIRSQNVQLGYLDLSDVAQLPEEFNREQGRSILQQDDLLINIVGASIGRAALADNRLEGANVNQAVALVRLKAGIEPSFVMNFLFTKEGQLQIRRQEKEIARSNISLQDIKDFRSSVENCTREIVS